MNVQRNVSNVLPTVSGRRKKRLAIIRLYEISQPQCSTIEQAAVIFCAGTYNPAGISAFRVLQYSFARRRRHLGGAPGHGAGRYLRRRYTQRQILRHFNLVAANFGGSLVAASLWADLTPNDLIGEFDRDAILQNMFRLSWLKAFPRSIFTSFKLGPKYSSERKLKAIAGVIDRYRPGLADTQSRRWSGIRRRRRLVDGPAAARL